MRAASQLRDRRADERGVALITVLVVIAFTFLVIGALFGLLSTSMEVTEAAERTAREARAADAAVETAVNRMRTEPCSGNNQPYLTDVEFDQGTASAADDVEVDVTCSSTGDETDQVRIVGSEGYQGPLEWTTDCAVDATEGCLAWTALGGVPGDLGNRNISLIHGGELPLWFGSGVSVRSGAAALRSDPNTPAIRVGGQYRQGDSGLGASGTDCGVLAGASGDGRGQIYDIDGTPECGNTDVRSLGNDGNSAVATEQAAGIPTCTGDVITFLPGWYDSVQTAQVNALTGGGCADKTFHFPEGIYEFQGDELVFADRGSFYVFGKPSGWSAPAGLVGTPAGIEPDAMLCDPNQRGATIVLNGWTALRHTGGRVAICPAVPLAEDGSELDPHAGIEQNPGVPTGVEVTAVSRTGPLPEWGSGIGMSGARDFRCRGALLDPIQGLGCVPERRYDLQLATQGRGPVDSLRVLLTADEGTTTPNNLITDRRTRLTLYSPEGFVCSTAWVPGMPNGGLTRAIDMKDHGGCTSESIDQRNLDGGRIRVDHRMTLALAYVVQSFDLVDEEIAVEVNAVSGAPTRVSRNGGGGSSGYTGSENMLATGGGVATAEMPGGCTDPVCEFVDGGTTRPSDRFFHEVEVDKFRFPAPFDSSTEINPNLTTLRAVVRITYPGAQNPNLFFVPLEPYLQLTTPSGARCLAQGRGFNPGEHELSFDLLGPDVEVGNGCSQLALNNMRDLQNASLTVRFGLPCVNNGWECLRNPANGRVFLIRPPSIDHIGLTAVTDTYAGRPPSSRVTIDVTDAAQSSAFNVYGRAWFPLSDLDLRWTGGAGATPLFGGNLMVHGLASWMDDGASMGIVCCAPPESRTVDLVATIDSVKRLVQTVDFIDVAEDGSYSQGHAVDVLEHRACGRGGCAVDDDDDPSP